MHSLKSTIVIDSPQRHVAPTSRLLFVSIIETRNLRGVRVSINFVLLKNLWAVSSELCRGGPCAISEILLVSHGQSALM